MKGLRVDDLRRVLREIRHPTFYPHLLERKDGYFLDTKPQRRVSRWAVDWLVDQERLVYCGHERGPKGGLYKKWRIKD